MGSGKEILFWVISIIILNALQYDNVNWCLLYSLRSLGQSVLLQLLKVHLAVVAYKVKVPTSPFEFSWVTEELLEALSNLKKEMNKINTKLRPQLKKIYKLSCWKLLEKAREADNLLVLFEVSEANKG